MKILDLIPSWWPLAAIGVLAAVIAGQQVHIAGLNGDLARAETKLAQEQGAREKERADRALLAAADAKRIKDQQAAHAVAIQENDNAWRKKLETRDRDVAARDRTIAGLRNARQSYTAATSIKREGDSDAIALARATGRLEAIGAMVDRSNDLLGRAEKIIHQRDAEVIGLLGVIDADRKACSAAMAAPTHPIPSAAPS